VASLADERSYAIAVTRRQPIQSTSKPAPSNGVVGSGADYKTRGIALFHDVNDNLKLVAEYNQFEINGHDTDEQNEDTDTFAVGAVLTW
jgi:hypothetical protein